MACSFRAALVAALPMVTAFATSADAQQGTRYLQCAGYINGIKSQALLEVTAGGIYTEGPGVAGQISNQFADYTFTGTVFGASEGYVSLVERRSGERIDRVWIGFSQAGFALRSEDGATYAFQCQG